MTIQTPMEMDPGNYGQDHYDPYYAPEDDYADAGVYLINEDRTSFVLDTAINGQYFPLILDTGSPITIITEEHQRKLGLNVDTQERVRSFHDFNGNGLNIIGTSQVTISLGKREVRANIIIVNAKTKWGLLGKDVMSSLGIAVHVQGVTPMVASIKMSERIACEKELIERVER